MSETTYESPDNPTDDDDKTVTLKRSQIRALEKAAKDNQRLSDENDTLKRDKAFADAGVDLKDPKTSYFMAGYKGDMTAEAIKKAAEEAGFMKAPELTPEQQEQLKATGAVAAAAQGAQPMNAASQEGMKAEMEKAMESGGKEAMIAVAVKYGARVENEFR